MNNIKFYDPSEMYPDGISTNTHCRSIEESEIDDWWEEVPGEKMDENDQINSPKHYAYSKVEPIDAIEAWGLDFRLANVVKYISRAGKKDPTKLKEDLLKAQWYLNRYISKEFGE